MTKLASSAVNYWLSYASDSSSAVFFLAWEIEIRRAAARELTLALTSGYLLWGLLEYVFHRWVYHRSRRLLGQAHRMHHELPRMLLAMPWFMTPAAMFGLWYLGSVMLGLPGFSAGLAGWLAGSLWYSVLHHSHHHWDIRNGWIRGLKTHHRIHHQLSRVNFGVTMRLWDDVFGTRHRETAR